MAEPIKVVLPYPPKQLNPNQKMHWAAKAKVASRYKEACKILTRTALGAMRFDKMPKMAVEFYPPDYRIRDDDNAIAAFKSGRDGVAEAMGVDDRHWKAKPEFCQPHPPHGSIIVYLCMEGP